MQGNLLVDYTFKQAEGYISPISHPEKDVRLLGKEMRARGRSLLKCNLAKYLAQNIAPHKHDAADQDRG